MSIRKPTDVMADQSAALRSEVNAQPQRRAHDGPLTGRNLVLTDEVALNALKARADAAETAARELHAALEAALSLADTPERHQDGAWYAQRESVGNALARHAAYGAKR